MGGQGAHRATQEAISRSFALPLPLFSGQIRPRAALGMINATTLENDPDTIIGLFNCTGTTFGAGGQANPHGTNHSVMADPVHNQIYVPIASTAFTGQTVPAICSILL